MVKARAVHRQMLDRGSVALPLWLDRTPKLIGAGSCSRTLSITEARLHQAAARIGPAEEFSAPLISHPRYVVSTIFKIRLDDAIKVEYFDGR